MKKFFGILIAFAALTQPAYAMQESGKKYVIAMPPQKVLEQVFIAHGLKDLVNRTDIIEDLSAINIQPVDIALAVGHAAWAYLKLDGYGSNTYEEEIILEDKIYTVLEEIMEDQPDEKESFHCYKEALRCETENITLKAQGDKQ